jgi:hypothetical protein
LRHVIRAEKGRGMEEAKKEGMDADQVADRAAAIPIEGGFEGQSEFITFEQGSPEAVSSSEGSDSEEEADQVVADEEVDYDEGSMDTDEVSEDEALGVVV